MSTSDPRTLFDEATRELPADVAQPPLAAIHRRVRRRRARLTFMSAAAVVLVAAGLVPLLRGPAEAPEPAMPQPTASVHRLPWSFAYRDGDQVKVYLHRQDCQVLDAPSLAVEPHGDTTSVSITGILRRPDDCTRAGIPMVELPRNAVAAGHILVDPATGRRPPLYDRAHLPLAWRGVKLDSYGASAYNADPEMFTARYTSVASLNKTQSAPAEVEIRGVDPAEATPSGEQLRVGPVDGVLYHELGEYRFVWRVPVPGGTELGYEVVPRKVDLSRAEFVNMLNGFTWR